MIQKITILSTCTNRKRAYGENMLSLAKCSGKEWDSAIDAWLNMVFSQNSQTHIARERYAGMHWQETLQCEEVIKTHGLDSDLWILSAGLGLIPCTFPVPLYSATFTNGPDSIHNLSWGNILQIREHCALWWETINLRRKIKLPNSILDIPNVLSSNNCIIVICSPVYLYAIEKDLCHLETSNPNFLIFCAGITNKLSAISPLLHRHIVPIDDRFKGISQENNGVNSALNAILAHWTLKEYCEKIKKSPLSIIESISSLANKLPPIKKKKVVPLSDDEIIAFIKMNMDSSSSATSLLRVLREKEGKSCEQKRFGKLFQIAQNK